MSARTPTRSTDGNPRPHHGVGPIDRSRNGPADPAHGVAPIDRSRNGPADPAHGVGPIDRSRNGPADPAHHPPHPDAPCRRSRRGAFAGEPRSRAHRRSPPCRRAA
ncbi:hypothetical protein JQN58_37340 [Aneurinibacillus sp. BA2021]|nr:hypothetical protein [Aneurinibacillus sp. BA2021]